MHMLRLRLLVDYRTEPIVEKRFRILAHISNQLRKHVKKQLSRLEKDKVYQELKKEYGRLKKLDPDNHKEVAADLARVSGLMDETINELGLTKSGLENMPVSCRDGIRKISPPTRCRQRSPISSKALRKYCTGTAKISIIRKSVTSLRSRERAVPMA